MEYKDTIKRSHPYEGHAPEESMSEKLPVMTGHDDQVEHGSGQGAPTHTLLRGTPYFQEQTPPPSRLEGHNHPGDDAYITYPDTEDKPNPGPYLGGGMKPRY